MSLNPDRSGLGLPNAYSNTCSSEVNLSKDQRERYKLEHTNGHSSVGPPIARFHKETVEARGHITWVICQGPIINLLRRFRQVDKCRRANAPGQLMLSYEIAATSHQPTCVAFRTLITHSDLQTPSFVHHVSSGDGSQDPFHRPASRHCQGDHTWRKLE